MIMKYIAVIICFINFFYVQTAYSQSIEFRCIQVNDSADVVLYWKSTNLPPTYQYKIYTSTSLSSSYLLLDSISNLLTDHYIHKNAHGDQQQNFYYIQACPSDGNISLPIYSSDTLGNILLKLDNQKTGVALLSWQYTNNFQSTDSFEVNRSFDSIWTNIHRTQQTNYNDTITFCGKNTYYRISYDQGKGCKNLSAKVSDFFSDFIAPQTAILDTVSINPTTGYTEIGWEKGISIDTYGYIVYFLQNIWITLDTLIGAENTFYVDSVYSAQNKSQQYRIATLDTCLNASPMGDEHQTLLLSASIAKCDSIVFLKWNNYINMPDGVDSFRVYMSEDNDDFKIVATVDKNTLQYDCKHLNTLHGFRFYIQAYSEKQKFTSTSNVVSVVFNRVMGSGNVWMRYVSVKDNKHIELAAYVNDTIDFKYLHLYKSIDSGKTFIHHDQQSKKSTVESYIFTDTEVSVHNQMYHYYFTLSDECDIGFADSDTAHNIVLMEGESEFQSNSLIWNAYEKFPSCVDGYDVYRKTQIQREFSLLSSESPAVNQIEDNVFGMAAEGGVFSYKVAAVACKWLSFRDESVSNTLEIRKKDTLYIPTAFYPNSVYSANQTFKPVCVFVDADNYEFKIYNRWGDEVFSTTHIDEGWDGTFNGKKAPLGVYAYHIRYSVGENYFRNRRGSVILLH